MNAVAIEDDLEAQRARISYDRQAAPVMNSILRRIGCPHPDRYFASDSDNGPRAVNIVSFRAEDAALRDRLTEAFVIALDTTEIPALLTPAKDALRDNKPVTDNIIIETENLKGSDYSYPCQFRVAVLGTPGYSFNHGWASASQKMLDVVKAVDASLEVRGFKDPAPGATFA